MSTSKSNSYSTRFETAFKWLFPSPFTIAIHLTLLTFILALFFQKPEEQGTYHIWFLVMKII